MRTIGWGITFGILGLMAAVAETRADSPDELTERLRKATTVLSEVAGGKQDTDIPREVLAKRVSDGRWSAPAFFTGGASACSSAVRSSTSSW